MPLADVYAGSHNAGPWSATSNPPERGLRNKDDALLELLLDPRGQRFFSTESQFPNGFLDQRIRSPNGRKSTAGREFSRPRRSLRTMERPSAGPRPAFRPVKTFSMRSAARRRMHKSADGARPLLLGACK